MGRSNHDVAFERLAGGKIGSMTTFHFRRVPKKRGTIEAMQEHHLECAFGSRTLVIQFRSGKRPPGLTAWRAFLR